MAAPRQLSFNPPVADHYEVVQDFGIGGATEKDVLRDPETGTIYIAKLGGRNNDVEVVTEFAIHVIGRSLGVSVARARIARFRGRLRFLSQYFLQRDPPEELVHGMQLFHQLYDESTVKSILGKEREEQALFSVQSVKAAFGAHYIKPEIEDALFRGFVAMLTHDALIGSRIGSRVVTPIIYTVGDTWESSTLSRNTGHRGRAAPASSSGTRLRLTSR